MIGGLEAGTRFMLCMMTGTWKKLAAALDVSWEQLT
jgi:hypothetical protein